jgi:hypothetical protein
MNNSIRYRYIVYGIPKQGHYTIEEAQWQDSHQRFIQENIRSVPYHVVKRLLGYVPKHTGEQRIEMWLAIPPSCQNQLTQESPLNLLYSTSSVHPFFPFSLGNMRHFINPDAIPEDIARQLK